jgi:hypothetical protein
MNSISDSEPDRRQAIETMISYGMVLRVPIERVPELKSAVLGVPGAEIVYQRTSVERLEIHEVPRRGL